MKKVLWIILSLVAIACSMDNPVAPEETELDTRRLQEKECECDTLRVVQYHGVACCITGSRVAAPGDTLNFKYHTNLPSPQLLWSVVNGSLTLIDGHDSTVASFVAGADFTTGAVRCFGERPSAGGCQEAFEITVK